MKPSDIAIGGPVPLTGTFGRAEGEQMAALIILTLADGGDEWRRVHVKEIGAYLRKVIDGPEKPPLWMDNPFFRPDPDELVKRGFASWVGDEERTALEFTNDALTKLRESPWNRASEVS